MRLLAVCPSYKRPRQAKELLDTFGSGADLVFAIGIKDAPAYEGLPIIVYPEWPMVMRTNKAALALVDDYDAIGWVADDNRFETPNWEQQVIQALEEMSGGIVYGNDLVDPGSKPSSVFMSAEIVKTLGWLILPGLRSTFQDDVWQSLGEQMGRLKYLPDLRIRHLYLEKNNDLDFLADMTTYMTWLENDLPRDAARCLAALRRKKSRRSSLTSTAPSLT